VREWPVPPAEQTIHLVGDSHFELMTMTRQSKIVEDLRHPLVPDVTVHVQTGDQNRAAATQDEAFRRFIRRVGGQWWLACGNHDIQSCTRTVLQWAAAYGMPGREYAVDLGYVKLLFISPPDFARQQMIDARTCSWLDVELGNAGKPCYVVNHFPLFNTVGGTDPNGPAVAAVDMRYDWTSLHSAPAFYVRPDTELRAVLANHLNAVAYLYGHTHNRLQVPNVVCGLDLGTHVMACVNSSSIAYLAKSTRPKGEQLHDPICTLFVTYVDAVEGATPAPAAIEVRARDHGAQAWTDIGGQRVRRIELT
jgi:hypothetical protein